MLRVPVQWFMQEPSQTCLLHHLLIMNVLVHTQGESRLQQTWISMIWKYPFTGKNRKIIHVKLALDKKSQITLMAFELGAGSKEQHKWVLTLIPCLWKNVSAHPQPLHEILPFSQNAIPWSFGNVHLRFLKMTSTGRPGKENIYSLLIEMQSGAATVNAIGGGGSQIARNRSTTWCNCTMPG